MLTVLLLLTLTLPGLPLAVSHWIYNSIPRRRDIWEINNLPTSDRYRVSASQQQEGHLKAVSVASAFLPLCQLPIQSSDKHVLPHNQV